MVANGVGSSTDKEVAETLSVAGQVAHGEDKQSGRGSESLPNFVGLVRRFGVAPDKRDQELPVQTASFAGDQVQLMA
jgi:hypothetical protein